MTRALSKSAGWEALSQGLTHPARTLARRLADGPGVLQQGQLKLGPIGIGWAIGWRPALKREAEERRNA